jgi:hypothetical protein
MSLDNDVEEEFNLPWVKEKDHRIELVTKACFKGERTQRTAWIKLKGPKEFVEGLEFFTFKQGEYIHVGISNFWIKEQVLPHNGRVKKYKRPEGVVSLDKWMK